MGKGKHKKKTKKNKGITQTPSASSNKGTNGNKIEHMNAVINTSTFRELKSRLDEQKAITEEYKEMIKDKVKMLETKQDEIDTLTTKNEKLARMVERMKLTMNENIDETENFCDSTKLVMARKLQRFKELHISKFENLMNEMINNE